MDFIGNRRSRTRQRIQTIDSVSYRFGSLLADFFVNYFLVEANFKEIINKDVFI